MSKVRTQWLIGEVADASGLSTKMIRHYESLGLIRPPVRSEGGYRYYDQQALDELIFIRQARELGFGLPQVAELLSLWRNESRHAADVHTLAVRHLAELDSKIARLQQMREVLVDVVAKCHGDQRADCPILEQLATGAKKGCHS
ncbi:MAG: Cu(I)-responsive transcriptional regulator [Aeromonadaceae bacterium]